MSEQSMRMPRIGDAAPSFEANTTHGVVKFPESYSGRWVILFSHPADFTPVCTTEFVAFAEIYSELQKRNVDLLGLSIDSNYSHIAWVRRIKEKLGVDIPFPIIADLTMEVANKFGMIHPEESATSAVRAVFVIDPQAIIRAIIYYPLNVGRNMQEILRLIDALQTADKHKVALPANWKPGDKVIVPPPQTQQAAEARMKEGYECIDWFLCKKSLETA
ncbi:MAG: peroxiredoxin [Candidatus Bathyarchaeia archaeon]